MKQVVSILLVLALCIGMPLCAFAAESSPGESAPIVPTDPTGDPSVDTGDAAGIEMWIIIMIIALLAMVMTTVFYTKSQKNR